jgi:hypothetical protein
MFIETVKQTQNGYLINGSICVPNDPTNSDCQTVQKWIAEGGEVELEFTLPESIDKKLQELDQYHYNAVEIRQCKINNYFILQLDSIGRSLIQEQILLLTQKIQLNLIQEADAVFEYFYNGGSIEISLTQLRQLYVAMLNIVNSNYQNYKSEIYLIKNLGSVGAVETHDFTLNYLKNQNITL